MMKGRGLTAESITDTETITRGEKTNTNTGKKKKVIVALNRNLMMTEDTEEIMIE